ncbi:hypothetical protein ACSAGD_14980 [Paramicrobacterium sp. CJ85]|uniref:hypothetical protein n=1 Tax=Paramicrobacterium sp. CJ85 TaxID=3445355 RepID=UPI003F619011
MGYSIALLVAGGVLVGPGDGLPLGGLIEDGLEGGCGVGGECVVLVEVDAGEERLVGEALVLFVAAFVHGGEVACEVEGSVDEGAGSLIVVVVFSDLGFDPIQFCPQPGLELLQLIQSEGIGEMGFEELVLLSQDLTAPDGLRAVCSRAKTGRFVGFMERLVACREG